jgi:hypothetical protein
MDRSSALSGFPWSPGMQARCNRDTRDFWHAYTSHRRRVSSFVRDRAPSAGSVTLCVLGAGNCNDLDLPELCARFAQVTLVDIDRDAVDAGIERQCLLTSEAARVRVEKLDLFGEVDTLRQHDVVLSCCVLSQLILEAASRSRDQQVWLGVRRKHVLDSLALTKDGGTTLLVTDFVSSDTHAELRTYPETHAAELVPTLVHQRNHFLGLGPDMVDDLITSDPQITALARPLGRKRYWRWDLVERTYLVAASCLSKRSVGEGPV